MLLNNVESFFGLDFQQRKAVCRVRVELQRQKNRPRGQRRRLGSLKGEITPRMEKKRCKLGLPVRRTSGVCWDEGLTSPNRCLKLLIAHGRTQMTRIRRTPDQRRVCTFGVSTKMLTVNCYRTPEKCTKTQHIPLDSSLGFIILYIHQPLRIQQAPKNSSLISSQCVTPYQL